MKMKDYGFYRGVDLGGWFSQCDYSEDRMDHFITEKDFRVIAGWDWIMCASPWTTMSWNTKTAAGTRTDSAGSETRWNARGGTD